MTDFEIYVSNWENCLQADTVIIVIVIITIIIINMSYFH